MTLPDDHFHTDGRYKLYPERRTHRMVRVNAEIHDAVRVYAYRHKRTIRAAIEDLLRAALAAELSKGTDDHPV